VRFFLGTAARFDVALGDPHPGNWLVDHDTRLIAFDFGMLRTLEPHFLHHEGQVHAALIAVDPGRLAATLRRHGYLNPDWAGDPELLREYLSIAGAHLLLGDQPMRLGPDYNQALMDDLLEFGRQGFDLVRTLSLPRQAVLYRRQQDLLYSTITDLRGSMDFRSVYGELLQDNPTDTPLGREEEEWVAGR